ncbi:MAG: HEAT repeat domain-containing protein [Anaerolineae bacterium]
MPDQQNRDAQLEAFEAKVRDNIKLLSAKDSKTRKQAAAWLGEAGDPTAITMLAQIYKSDPDPQVRNTAKYALGMFRKLEEELKSDPDRVTKLLEDVAVQGKIGRRVPYSNRTLIKLAVGLLISAVLVFLAGLVLPPILKQTTAAIIDQQQQPQPPTAVPVANKDRATLTSDLQYTLNVVTGNVTKLQAEYQGVLGGGQLNCSEFFDTLLPVAISEDNAREFTDLDTISSDINNAEASFRSASATYDRACGGETIPASEFGAPMAEAVALIQSVANIQSAINTALGSPPASEATADSESASATTVPTDVPVNVRPHVLALQAIVDDMTRPDGANSLLTQYWNDSITPGGTTGCSRQIAAEAIPANYNLPDDAISVTELKSASDLINNALEAVRRSRELFATACTSSSVAAAAQQGLIFSDAAKQAFDGATVLLNQFK